MYLNYFFVLSKHGPILMSTVLLYCSGTAGARAGGRSCRIFCGMSLERSFRVNGMVWVRILLGAVWLNGAVEKILNPRFPQQFANSLDAGGFVTAAPLFFQSFMQRHVIPNAEMAAQLVSFGELALGLALLFGFLTNLAALGSALYSVALVLAQGGLVLGQGLGSPGFMTINVVVAVLSVIVLLSPAAKSAALDAGISRGRPRLAPLLINRRGRRRA